MAEKKIELHPVQSCQWDLCVIIAQNSGVFIPNFFLPYYPECTLFWIIEKALCRKHTYLRSEVLRLRTCAVPFMTSPKKRLIRKAFSDNSIKPTLWWKAAYARELSSSQLNSVRRSPIISPTSQQVVHFVLILTSLKLSSALKKWIWRTESGANKLIKPFLYMEWL